MSRVNYASRIKQLEKEVAFLRKQVKQLWDKLESLPEEVKERVQVKIIEVNIDLPDHLRRTVNAMPLSVEVTAQQVADVTGRKRAMESDYLNQLARLGCIKKIEERRGKTVCFLRSDSKPH